MTMRQFEESFARFPGFGPRVEFGGRGNIYKSFINITSPHDGELKSHITGKRKRNLPRHAEMPSSLDLVHTAAHPLCVHSDMGDCHPVHHPGTFSYHRLRTKRGGRGVGYHRGHYNTTLIRVTDLTLPPSLHVTATSFSIDLDSQVAQDPSLLEDLLENGSSPPPPAQTPNSHSSSVTISTIIKPDGVSYSCQTFLFLLPSSSPW